MLKLEQKIQIKNLSMAGLSVPEISRRLGFSTGTIYKHLKDKSNKSISRITHKHSKVQPFIFYVDSRLKNGISNTSKIYQELLKIGYNGSYSLINSYIKQKSSLAEGYKRSRQLVVSPGEQAQVDWGSFGRITIDGKQEKLYAFVYVLSYSRTMYVQFVVRQNQKTFQDCHMNAFEKLGIPKKIVYDNVRTVILSREKLSNGEYKFHYNPAFIDFSRYYGFKPYVCPPYWPRTKGRVESGVKYLKNNFMNGNLPKKEFDTLESLNLKVTQWVEDIANKRVHKTTNEIPIEAWLKERDFLIMPKLLPRYVNASLTNRFSTKDALVQYKSCFYSVPSQFARKKLFIRDISQNGLPYIEIYFEDILIAKHKMSYERAKWVIDDSHFEEKLVKKLIRAPEKIKRKKIKFLNEIPRIIVATRDLKYYNLLLPKNKYVKKKN